MSEGTKNKLFVAVGVSAIILVAVLGPSLSNQNSSCAEQIQEIYMANLEDYRPESLEPGFRTVEGIRCPVDRDSGYTIETQTREEGSGFAIRCDSNHWSSDGFREGHPHFDSLGGWCMSPGVYPGMSPSKYLELNVAPKL